MTKPPRVYEMLQEKGRRTLCHQFPLRPDYLAQVVIPGDLTKAEADRLCAFVMALAQPDATQPQPKCDSME